MKNTIKAMGILLLLFMLVGNTNGQQKFLQGQVTTFDSIPLINASVTIMSTKEVIMTDSIGMFKAMCSSPDKIKVSANGFIPRKVKVDEDIKLVLVNLNLKPTEKAVEIATGYGHVKDADKLNAMASLHNNKNDFSMYPTIFDAIVGRFPGVAVQGDEIIIRGMSSILGSNAALIVLDGMIVDGAAIKNIHPETIKSVSVLKDAAASQYGARGANGVVVVETKKGDDR